MSTTNVSKRVDISVQNPEVAPLIRSNYDLATLEAVRKALAEHGTLKVRRYSSGGCSAVTVLDIDFTLEKALDGQLDNQWDRDCIMQTLAESAASLDPQLAEATQISPNAWKRGLLSCLTHHHRNDFRFLDVIFGRVSGYAADFGRRPNIRYNPISLAEVGDPWGHAQNDSLAFVNFKLFHSLNEGRLFWSDPSLQPAANVYACLLHHYWWKLHVWEDWELGAWEDKNAEHWSSIACALVSLREQLKFMRKHGPLYHHANGGDFSVYVNGVEELIEKCETKLRELDTKEFIRSDNGEVRDVDLAQINPLLLAAIAGQPVLDDATTVKVIDKVQDSLMGHLGIRRFNRDVWDGRVNRRDLAPGEEAQWCHGSPTLSVLYGDLYQRTGNAEYLERQTFHFNRALASLTTRWLIPECWIVDRDSRQWIADENEPLAWGQSMLILALAWMKSSLTKEEELKAAAASTASAAGAVTA